MGAAFVQGIARVTHESNVPLRAEVVTVRSARDRAAVELDAARWPSEVVHGGQQFAARTGPFQRDADLSAAGLFGAGVWALGVRGAFGSFWAF
jgi:hypothetical protein